MLYGTSELIGKGRHKRHTGDNPNFPYDDLYHVPCQFIQGYYRYICGR